MRRWKRMTALLAAVIACCVLCTGCAKSGDDTESTKSGESTHGGGTNMPSGSVVSPGGSQVTVPSGASDVQGNVNTPSVPVASNATDFTALDAKARGWGQGTQVDDKNRPISSVQYQEKYGKYGAYFIAPESKKVYLTFDEGYENGYSAKILDALKEKKASGVFFVTYDYVKKNPDLVRRMIDEGHIVGNHSYNHPSMPKISMEKGKEEIQKLHDYVKAEFNYTMTLFRPPMGEYSEQTLAMTQSLGYKTIFWSFAYKDWDPKNQMGADKAKEKVLKSLHPGAIYLLHAVSKDNAEILGAVIDEMRNQGYEIAKFDL